MLGLLLIGSLMIPPEIDLALKNAAKQTKIPIDVLRSVAKEESDYNPKAKSGVGALGLMQLMPIIIETYKVKDPFNPHENALAGAKSLSTLFRHCKGHWPRVLASYNWGIGNVNKHPNSKEWPTNTQKYVNDIMIRAKQYFALWI